jgi:hypothetical protein
VDRKERLLLSWFVRLMLESKLSMRVIFLHQMMVVHLVYEFFTIAIHFCNFLDCFNFFTSMIIRYLIRAYSIEHGIESSGFVWRTVFRITGDESGRGSPFPENLEF